MRIVDNHLSSYTKLNDAHFGFREGMSTESAIVPLKYTVDYWKEGRKKERQGATRRKLNKGDLVCSEHTIHGMF